MKGKWFHIKSHLGCYEWFHVGPNPDYDIERCEGCGDNNEHCYAVRSEKKLAEVLNNYIKQKPRRITVSLEESDTVTIESVKRAVQKLVPEDAMALFDFEIQKISPEEEDE